MNEPSNVLAKATDDKLKKYCFIYRAFSYNELKDFKNAISDLDKAIELDPNDLASYTDEEKQNHIQTTLMMLKGLSVHINQR